MNKFQKYAKKYFFYFIPIMLILVLLNFVVTNKSHQNLDGDSFIYWLIGGLVILWFLDLVYLAFAILLSRALKNLFVRKIARIRENDEREVQLTGAISRDTFITTVAICVFLLIFSMLRFEVYKFKDKSLENGKNGRISAGFGFKIIETADEKKETDPNHLTVFNYDGLPLSADGVLLLILGVQVGAFYYHSRKEYSL